MKRNETSNAAVTERFRNLNCPETEKQNLHKYLMSILSEGKSFLLQRNRVMIMEQDNKNRFIILDRIDTSDETRFFYICPSCSNIKFSSYLTGKVSAKEYRSCLHSEVCKLLWGDMSDPNNISEEGSEETDLVEVVAEKPRYLAIVHPAAEKKKCAGVVTLSSKTLKPRCLSCKGQDRCIHLTIHYQQYKHGMEESKGNDETGNKMRMDRVESQKPQKDKVNKLDPYSYDGPEANVFNIRINFLKTKGIAGQSFNKKILAPKYDPREVCKDHGNKYDEHESILNMESCKIIIHHTKDVDTSDTKVLFRPTILKLGGDGCACKKWYSGQDDQLLRVSSANENMKGRPRTLHFVTYEFYFGYLSQLLMGGETLHAQIKAKRFMDENFFDHEKKPEFKKVLQKGFEIFIHALEFPEDSNYCYACPQELGSGEKEDDFKDIEYSIIDGIQMGCRTNSSKADIEDEFFEEAVVEGIVANGIECKDRTFCKSQQVRNILATLLKTADEPLALKKAVEALCDLELDANSRSILNLLNRLLFRNRSLPLGYRQLLHELHLPTPVSALLTAYSSERHIYELFMNYLNNKDDIFSSPTSLEVFMNSFPVLMDCMKEILQTEILYAEGTIPQKRTIFLPHDVSDILKNLIKLRFSFDKLSRKLAVPRTTPSSDFKPPLADFFPAYPVHTMENIYKADSRIDNAGKEECDKNFDSASSISGGIGTVSCNHKITKGFRAIQKGESPLLFCHSLFRRLPQKVRAHKRVVIYDFACKLHKVCLRRYPYRIRRFQFVIDRYHQSNHKACSESYNISKYPEMSHVNTQVAEQLNNSLRKLGTVVAYSNFKTYLRIIQVFITVKNLTIKGVI